VSRVPLTSLAAAFPNPLAEQVHAVELLLEQTRLPPASPLAVRVDGQTLRVPYRIYHRVPDTTAMAELTTTQQLICTCLFTRHHDGMVRQANLERIVTTTLPWIAPYVVQLVGEYVIQIVLAIRRELTQLDIAGTDQQKMYGRFVTDNPAFLNLVRQRVASYWDGYYRQMYSRLRDYPQWRFFR
jgi:hypothetical protein